MSTMRCFSCGEMGHYAGQCPKKKKKKQQDDTSATTKEVEFDAQLRGSVCSSVVCQLLHHLAQVGRQS
jgi:hypothetical protein